MEICSSLRNIIGKAEAILSKNFDVNDAEVVEDIDQYLIMLEEWQIKYGDQLKSLSEGQVSSDLSLIKDELKVLLTQLEEHHSLIMSKSNSVMADVKTELGKVSQKSKAIKKYISPMPVPAYEIKKKG